VSDQGRRAALTGELSQVPLWDILQTLQTWTTPGVIEVDGCQELATLHFEWGRIVKARCGLRRGEAAVYRALRLRRGHFSVRRASASRQAPLALSITAAILEGVRRHDECERVRAQLPDEDVLLSWAFGRVPLDLRGVPREAAELFVVPRTIDEAIRASSEDELSLLEALVPLVVRLASRPVSDVATAMSVAAEASIGAAGVEASSSDAPPPPGSEPAPLRDDYELVTVDEPSQDEALVEQSTLEPFIYEPEADGARAPSFLPSTDELRQGRGVGRRASPRVLAVLASVAMLLSFSVTSALLPARQVSLISLEPEVARWLNEAWPCDQPPPSAIADRVCAPSRR